MAIHSRHFAIAATATVLWSLAFGSAGLDLQVDKKAYVRTGQEATLVGNTTFTGTPPKPLSIDMTADPSCYDNDRSKRYSNKTEWIEVRDGRIANVLVYVTSDALADYTFELPSEAALLAHINCRYKPHVMGIRLAQPLNIVNADRTQHTHPTPKHNPEWNQTQPIGAPPIIKTFHRAEVAIPFKDNQHPWEKAYVAVFEHPFFAVSDADGNFRIEGLPPGSYKIKAWHERLGEKTIELVLVPGESRYLEFTFSMAESKDNYPFER